MRVREGATSVVACVAARMGAILRALVVLALVGCVTTVPAIAASAALEPCPKDDDCARLVVPLDRSGAVPGTLRLDVERSGPEGATQPPLVAIGGIPGQISTSEFDPTDLVVTLRPDDPPGRVFVGGPREVVVMNLRGTGSSALRCDALQRATAARISQAAAECAATLGPRRAFYTAEDSAQDVEALREALGVERIALLGSLHGARVAFAYARRYPERVERLLLQSPPPPAGHDLLGRSSLTAVTSVAAARCTHGRCRRASATPVDDVVAVAQRLERGPVTGTVIDQTGRRRRASIDGADLFALLGDDLTTTSADAVGLVHNARRGDYRPLLRSRQVARWYRQISSAPPSGVLRYFSSAAHAASVCEEGVLPWSRSAPLDARPGAVSTFVAGLPVGAFHPFGPRTALQAGWIDFCMRWPVASAAPPEPTAIPAIPTLLLAPTEDLSAPVPDADAVARLIPGARVLKLPGSGPDLSLFLGSCVSAAVRVFMAGGSPADCGRPEFVERADPAPPLSLSEVPREDGVPGRAGRTLRAVRMTLRDGAEMLQARFFATLLSGPITDRRVVETSAQGLRTGALRRGTYRLGRRGKFTLRAASYVSGVVVDGAVPPAGGYSPRHGTLKVTGPAAAHGKLLLRGWTLTGRLGGYRIRAKLGGGTYPDIVIGR